MSRFDNHDISVIESRDIFGLTGGMGSGKSTVSKGFETKGAVIIDADRIVRDLQLPGEPVLAVMLEVLGDEILDNQGQLDRPIAASKMFATDQTRKRIEQLSAPYIRSEMINRVESTETDDLLILDAPLLIEAGWHELPLKGIVVVDTPIETAVERIVKFRGFSEEIARSRIAIQLDSEERVDHADYVIHNGSTEESLAKEINKAWEWIHTRRALGSLAIDRQ